ncbi:MAG TPA: hypothetical protein DD435_08595 [Cyanobacteria bacterium UBA8530]|nr:hypothetical protein [Cyanobacteria bacterium UBA8530]
MSLEVGPRTPQSRTAQRTPPPAASRTDGESPAPIVQTPPVRQGVAALTLGDIWDGIAKFLKSAFTAMANLFKSLFSPAPAAPLDPDSAAIAQAYNLLPTSENVQAFLTEAKSYETTGAIGPGASPENVKVLQQALGKLGYNVQANGDFDQATNAAVIDFKKKNGIHQSYKLADGNFAVNEFAEPTTLNLIQQLLQQQASLPPIAQPPVTSIPEAPIRGNEAIVKQYHLLSTQENVDAFLAETKAYKTNGTLGPGMEAPADIKELQTILSKWGYQVKLNGVFDEATAAAVIKFKQDAGIHQNYRTDDGNWAINEYADQATLAKMMEMIEKDQKPSATTPTAPSGNVPAGNGTLDFNAVAKQYGLQATKENVDAFMTELTAYEKNGTLGPGANAPEDIKELQGALSRWGYSIQVNGQYDDATCQAIIKFKKDNGLSQSYKLADGSVAVNEYAGPDTLTKILERVDKELAEQKNNPVQPSTPIVPQTTQPTAPVQTTETDPQVATIAKQYGLQANKANIDAFLKEIGDYEKNGALGPGSTATADVKELQQILKGWGYSLDVNGQYDQKTSAAILGFKQQNGIHQSYKLADGNFAVNEYADQATLVKILEKVGK